MLTKERDHYHLSRFSKISIFNINIDDVVDFEYSLINGMDVWDLKVDHVVKKIPSFESVLSVEEKNRSKKFVKLNDANTYICARWMLRLLSSRYLKIAASDLQFKYNKFNKPYFANSNLSFNLSHCSNRVLLAFNTQNFVGIDVESLNRNVDFMSIAEKFFHPSEIKKLKSLPSEQQKLAFFRCWTRKEAVLKYLGCGLNKPLDRFEVSLMPGENPQIIASNEHEMLSIKIEEIFNDENNVAAIAFGQECVDYRYIKLI